VHDPGDFRSRGRPEGREGRRCGGRGLKLVGYYKNPRRDAIAELISFWGFGSEMQTNPMSFHLDLP